MNLNLRHSYPFALLRGRVTQPITFSPAHQDPVLLLEGHWLLNSYDFYVALDCSLTNQYQEMLKAVESLRATPKQKLQELQTTEVVTLLERWLLVVKKMQFYGLIHDIHDLFYHENGLLDLITHGDMHCLHLISEIGKYRIKNNEEGLTLTDLGKDQVETVLRDVSLKMSRHILSQLRAEMYCPSRQLAAKLLKFYGITYNFECSFQQNYRQALSEKKIDNHGTSRQTLTIFFTIKVVVSLQQLEGVCHYVGYLKNILLDKNNGILTVEYETWALVYEICLRLYSRNEMVRLKQWIQIDQILSSPIADTEFQLFMVRNCGSESVPLSSINFYLKNSRKEEREELKPHILNKISSLIDGPEMWKYIEDIHEYIDSELTQENKANLLAKILARVVSLIDEHPAEKEVYEIEYGLTFILQNSTKYLHLFDQLFTAQWLAKATTLLEGSNEKTYCVQVLLAFRLFNQFLDNIYTEANYESWDCPDMKQVLHLADLFFCHNFVCSKAVFKLIYFKLSSEENNEAQWDKFFSLLAEHFFTGGYQDNSDLELIHSHDKYREAIASKILGYFQMMIPSQLAERKELIRCLESTGDGHIKGSYFALRAFKDGLIFQSIQNICLLFNSHLSMQTLEFGLNYCTPFAVLSPWQAEEEEISILSLICEEMPIETLKFIYKQVLCDVDFDYDFLQQLSPHFWNNYWLQDSKAPRMAGFAKLTIEQFDALQKLRRFEFILNLSCCVFDKLNQNSQKNIKQIKIIYENGAGKIKDIVGRLRETFFEAMLLQLGTRICSMLPEEVRNMALANQHSSVILQNYIQNNNLLYVAGEFNRIGAVNQHALLQSVQDTLLPCFLRAYRQRKELKYEILQEQLLLCLNLETTWFHRLVDASDQDLSHIRTCPPPITKEWVKETSNNIKRLHSSLAKLTPTTTIDNWTVLRQRINEHIKGLIARIMLPEMLSLLLTSESRPQLCRSLYLLMRWGVQLINFTDGQYEQHFIILIQKLQQVIRASKGTSIHSSSILCLLQLFFELIFNRIRIRSYHLYRIIKYYQKTTGESAQQFNCIIAQHIRLLFEEFITNYKNIPEIQQLCGSRKVIPASYQKFNRTTHSLTYIEAACTLSMFINLFCRLNFSSLAVGIETIFAEQEAKAMYIDYLNALTRKIVTEEMEISQRDREILKVDVYGNLSIISQGTLSERLLNKVVSLAKNLLRVKIDLKGVNKLPIKLLAAKIATEQLDVNLQQFEDECKAISLGAISVHKKLGAYVSSNLHLCNIYFIVGRNLEKYVQLNQNMFDQNRKELASDIAKIGREGVSALKICIGEEMRSLLQGLVRKMEKYYEISLKDSQYVQKLYSIFKTICITCLNTPQIIPIVLSHPVHINRETMTFQSFTFLTLKICLPLFCEFYTTLIKTNCGFTTISADLVVSANLQIQIEFRTTILQLFRQQIVANKRDYPYVIKAICYIQEYSQSNRFRAYKFGKNSNEAYECILKEYEKEFNRQIIGICQMFIEDGTEKTAVQCQQIYQILEITMEKYYRHNSQLDCKKINTEEQIRKMYCLDSEVEGSKEHLPQQKTSKSGESSHHKRQDSHSYHPIMAQILQINALKGQKQESQYVSTRGKKLKDLKQMKLNCIQEDIIGVNDCRQLCVQWAATASSINSIMVQKLKLFTEEIENKQFMKDLSVVFHSKNGVQLLPPADIFHQLGGINIQEAPSFGCDRQDLGADGIVESAGNIQEELACDELANFSNKIIEGLPIVEMIMENEGDVGRDSDSVIYSQMELEKGEDGSMKLFGEEEESPNQGDQIREEVTKNDIISLIEDCALNPEAKKQISFSIKYVTTPELTKLLLTQSGEIGYIIETELRNRGVALLESKPHEYEGYFMDESKIYERLRWNRRLEDTQIVIPSLSRSFVRSWLEILLRMVGQQRISMESKHTSSFCKRILLQLQNIEIVTEECLALLQMPNNDFELRYREIIPFNQKFTAQLYKQSIADEIFGLMLQHRIGLPIIFYASCNADGKLSKHQQQRSTRVIEILLQTLLNSNEPQSILAKNILGYTNTLGKVTKYQYPYYDIQDCLTFQQPFIQNISERLHLSHQTLGQNDKRFCIFKIMIYLDVDCFREFLKTELSRFAEVIRKVYVREDNVLQVFRKNYCGGDGVELERRAEIYWQMRKSKNADQFSHELVFSRRLLTEIGSVVLEQFKQNCFAMYYKEEDLKLKEEIAHLRRRLPEVRKYSEKCELEKELKEQQMRYTFWRKNLINLFVTEEVIPALQQVAVQFLEQLGKAANLFTDLYSIFHQIINTTPIIFKQAAEFYKLMLAFEQIKGEEQQTYHSMSILKTLPSIQSTREMAGRRKRSRLIETKQGIFQPQVCDLTSLIKKSAQRFTVDSLFMENGDVLFGMHAKNADTETKVRYLKQENKLGDKVIEVSRESMWADTFPHLDQNFRNYNIKIKIKGEMGLDYGGVTREWVTLLAKEVMDPKLGLFQLNANQLTFQPSKFSYLVPNHLQIFKRFGIFVGKAMKQNWLLEINFTKSFLKHMLGALLYVEDLQDMDPDTANGLLWILKNYVDEDLCLDFTYQEQMFSMKKVVQLVPAGAEVMVHEVNKKDYVKKLAYTKMTENIREQSLAFIEGIEQVIPIHVLKLFNYREIGKILAGVSVIDITQMKRYAKYEGYTEENQNVRWFWETMQKRSEEDKAEFLFFLTGSYRVPYSGFKNNPVTINRMPACKDYCPVAHTCFSIIDLPEYSSLQKLDQMLQLAVKEGKGFTVS